jgi:hypothetical protein
MHILQRQERGQTAVEFGIICSVLFLLTIGLIDVGRAFYQYNAISAAARYGSRWGGVAGGTCIDHGNSTLASGGSTVSGTALDWCTQEGSPNSSPSTPPLGNAGFWNLNGNRQLQPAGTSCPTDLPTDLGGTGNTSYYYTVSNFMGTNDTSIVGAVAHKFDSSSSSSNLINGGSTPGFDLSKMRVCIQLPSESNGSGVTTGINDGEPVTVYVYYPFKPAGPLFGNFQMPLVASAQYVVE